MRYEINPRIGTNTGHIGLWFITTERGGLHHSDTIYRRLFLLKMIVKSMEKANHRPPRYFILIEAIRMIENKEVGEVKTIEQQR